MKDNGLQEKLAAAVGSLFVLAAFVGCSSEPKETVSAYEGQAPSEVSSSTGGGTDMTTAPTVTETADGQLRVSAEDYDVANNPLEAEEIVTPRSLEEFVRTSSGGLIVATVASEEQGRTQEDRGEGFGALRDLELSVEQTVVGSRQVGSTAILETDGWYTSPEGEQMEQTEIGCGRIRSGQRVLISLLANDPENTDSFATSCYGWFILQEGQVVDTGRTAGFIVAAEQLSEAELISEIEELVRLR